jgi:hypothetical protein
MAYGFLSAFWGKWGTTVKLEGLPQFWQILTVKMPTDPIIIIIGSWF